jgi:deferrochelatase/peroxidase EfeB
MSPIDPDNHEAAGEATTAGESTTIGRRRLLGLALGGGAAFGAVAAFADSGGRAADASGAVRPGNETVGGEGPFLGSYPFFGPHQGGIITPAQDRLFFASFDLLTEDRDEFRQLMQRWTAAAEAMTRGADVGRFGAVGGPYKAPPEDTGEAIGLPPGGLTITFGFGRSAFVNEEGNARFGLGDRLPRSLIELPHFPADQLKPERSGGDLCVQACSADPQVAVHAVRNLARIAAGTAAIRWSQLGFGRTSSTSSAQRTPRNLFGFKDGTANLTAEQGDKVEEHVWVHRGDDPDSEWLAGGSYLVCRRINMHIETWDRTSLEEQELVTGRDKGEGAPLSGGQEFTAPDFSVQGSAGPLIPKDSHVFLAHPDQNNGIELLRRGYNFADGTDGLGRLDAGLFFIAFVRDPGTHYVPMQMRLSSNDRMMEYLVHTGSALFAVPPGCEPGSYVGAALLER